MHILMRFQLQQGKCCGSGSAKPKYLERFLNAFLQCYGAEASWSSMIFLEPSLEPQLDAAPAPLALNPDIQCRWITKNVTNWNSLLLFPFSFIRI
jgi:hypothetical protein